MEMVVSTTKQVKIPVANTCNYTSFIMRTIQVCNIELETL